MKEKEYIFHGSPIKVKKLVPNQACDIAFEEGGQLAAYGMETCEYEVIRHNENITCKVVNDGKAYVLRIHQPIEGFCVSLIKDGKSVEKWYTCNSFVLGRRHPDKIGGRW